MRGKSQRAFSLIELLVVLAVVCVVLAVLLPAVQSARAAARRASCASNLKQVGLALHNYAQALGTLPLSMTFGEGTGNGHSAFTQILPFEEQAALYNSYNFWLENWHAANHTTVGARVNDYLCADNPDVANVPADDIRFPERKAVFAKGHYGVNWGGGHKGWNQGAGAYRRLPPKGGARGPWGEDFMKERGIYLGVIMAVTLPGGDLKAKDGNPLARSVRLADITDGLSSTLAIVEKRDSFGWAVGGWGGSEFDVHTSPAYEGDVALARKVYSGATHAEGPNAVFCDGSVRALSPKQDRSIWYALITRSGGEVVKFDK
jgi:prepilin-type N-terminal cleavage/methylation domain-containing protein/prepilin-type processing-associated H-X9-DG protein